MNLERVFGPLAQALNPTVRALQTVQSRQKGDGQVSASPASLEITFETAALEPGCRRALEERAAIRLSLEGGRGTLLVPRDTLAELASEHPCAGVLLEAGKCLERRPNPPEIMGVINVTPDSFSDGGLFLDPERAVGHGIAMAAAGATVLDVGGESTRPGAEPVGSEEEARRVVPVVRALAERTQVRISIDTTKAHVARAALDAGASLVNDVRAGEADPEMLPLIAERGCDYALMHSRGTPKDMQVDPRYRDATAEVAGYLRSRVHECLRAGIDVSKIVVDPGIGFGKRLNHNLSLLRRLSELRSLGRPLLVGVSRKSFIGHITGTEGQADWRSSGADSASAQSRLGGTAAALTVSVLGGAEMLRVHDVGVMAEAAAVATALRESAPPGSSEGYQSDQGNQP